MVLARWKGCTDLSPGVVEEALERRCSIGQPFSAPCCHLRSNDAKEPLAARFRLPGWTTLLGDS